MRNALGTISTALPVMSHPGTPTDEAARQRSIIERQLRHLAAQLDELLEVSRLVSGPTESSAAAPDPSAQPAVTGRAPRRHVLVIEDNADAREALRALLEVWGHRVETAADGPGGFEVALATRPDVVVVDIGLPGLDGYHVAHGLRASLGQVFLIALTGHGQPDDRRRALEAGFDLHLVKPVDPQTLAAALAGVPAIRR